MVYFLFIYFYVVHTVCNLIDYLPDKQPQLDDAVRPSVAPDVKSRLREFLGSPVILSKF